MDKNGILNLLNDWNLWKQDLETGIQRSDYLNRLQGYLSTDQIIVITGPRRSGKSYIMRQFAKELIAKGVDTNEILMVNKRLSEDERLNGAQIKRFLLLHKELNPDDGEITRTRKVRRKFVAEKYGSLIEALYTGKDSIHVETTFTYEDGRTTTIRADLAIRDAETF